MTADYYADGKRIVIKAEDGRAFEKEATVTEPDRDKYDDIRTGSEDGAVKFTDVARFSEEEEFLLDEVRLIYNGEMVALRKVEPVYVNPSDDIEIAYEFELKRDRGVIKAMSPVSSRNQGWISRVKGGLGRLL
jgi:hypothetical protein